MESTAAMGKKLVGTNPASSRYLALPPDCRYGF